MANDVTVELHHSDAWQDITTDVRQLDPIQIDWGRKDEAAKPSPSLATLTLHDPAGKYSPRNPTSSLYGLIGRNTPIRVRLGARDARLDLPGVAGGYASTPDTAVLDITGDIDIRIEITPPTWRPDSDTILLSKYQITGDNRSFALLLTTAGELRLWWSTDGTFAGLLSSTSDPIPASSTRLAVRVTLDVDNGAAGHDVAFYTSDSIAGTWTQLGTTDTTAGVTSIDAGASPLELGAGNGGIAFFTDSATFTGGIHDAEIYDGIAGTLAADPAISGQDPADTTWTGDDGLTWTLHGTAALSDPTIRFAGEVSSWPQRWDLSETDVRIPIQGAGLRRRLAQGAKPLRSALFRDLSGSSNVVAYWPCEDGKNAAEIAPAVGDEPLGLRSDVRLASYTGSAASDALPEFGAGYIIGRMPQYSAANDFRFTVLVHLPDDGIPGAGRTLFALWPQQGGGSEWRVETDQNGDLRVYAWDEDGTLIVNSGVSAHGLNGLNAFVWLWLSQNGADIDWQFGSLKEGDTVGTVTNGTVTNETFGRIRRAMVGAILDLDGTAIGHAFALNDDVNTEFWDAAHNSLIAWSGETAVDRITRLCDEEAVPLRVIGDPSDSTKVGPQRVSTFLDLVDEAADADFGLLTDDRDTLRLAYRTGASLLNQSTSLTLDYSANEVAPDLEPVDDDQSTRNDVTVTRPEGSSARAVLVSGALSTQAPPNGVGRYDTEVEANVATDGQLGAQAGWRMHLGTVDEARYPSISVDLTATPARTTDVTGVRPGDKITITNPPTWLPPEDIEQLAQGGQETLTPHRHTATFNASPASPWTVGLVSDGTDEYRADTDGSETAASFTSGTDTSLSVAITEGPLWTIDAGELPFHIRVAGVVLNVTAISGTASPQTFTVDITPVNGVAKTIPAGSDVRLDKPTIIGP